MYIPVLEQFLDNVSRVKSLEGNQGRKVSRVVEQYFQSGVMRLTVTLDQVHAPLAFATYIQGAADSVEDANLEMQLHDIQAVFSVESSQLEGRAITFKVVAQPPQSMRERQAFLSNIARGVERLAVLLPAYGQTEHQVLDGLFEDTPEDDTPEERESYLDAFNALVEGDMAFVSGLPMSLVHYAGLLNPAVADESLRASEALAIAAAHEEPHALT